MTIHKSQQPGLAAMAIAQLECIREMELMREPTIFLVSQEWYDRLEREGCDMTDIRVSSLNRFVEPVQPRTPDKAKGPRNRWGELG